MGGLLSLGHAIAVVKFLWTVEAQPYAKALRRKETTPFFIYQRPVGLDAVEDPVIRAPVFALEIHDFLKVIDSQDGRLSAMPCEADQRIRRSFDVLDNIFLQQIVGHTERLALGIEEFFLQVVTVVAVQVADSADRFRHHLKLAGSFGRCYIIHPWTSCRNCHMRS